MSGSIWELSKSDLRRLLIAAAVMGARRMGYGLRRRPGRGLSSIYELTKDGESKLASLRTSKGRWIAFPPLAGGTQWKTLDDVDLVLVSLVRDAESVDVYLFPADEVRQRFDMAYAARSNSGLVVADNFGMWVKVDATDGQGVDQVGAGLGEDHPAIAQLKMSELQASLSGKVLEFETALASGDDQEESALSPEPEHGHSVTEQAAVPSLSTVADVLAFARTKIAQLTDMPADTVKVELKIGG